MGRLSGPQHSFIMTHSIDVSVETLDGEYLDLGQVRERFDELRLSPNSLKPILHLTAMMIALRRLDPEDDPSVFQPRFEIVSYLPVLEAVVTTTDFLDLTEEYIAVELRTMYENTVLLILRKRGEIWERVGLGSCELPSWVAHPLRRNKCITLG